MNDICRRTELQLESFQMTLTNQEWGVIILKIQFAHHWNGILTLSIRLYVRPGWCSCLGTGLDWETVIGETLLWQEFWNSDIRQQDLPRENAACSLLHHTKAEGQCVSHFLVDRSRRSCFKIELGFLVSLLTTKQGLNTCPFASLCIFMWCSPSFSYCVWMDMGPPR